MDVRLQGNPQRVYGVNGGAAAATRSSHTAHDDTLLFLSQEEKECIQFFENTIDSLEDSLEDETQRNNRARTLESHRRRPVDTMDAPPISSPTHGANFTITPSHKDQDIIDLVQQEPDLVQTRDPVFSPMNPDFQSLQLNPESHFEIKPRHDPMDSHPSEYNPPLPSGSYGPSDTHSYHPPGSIPTPVLIAQKIAENQGGSPTNIHPSAIFHRLSLESEQPLTEPQAKHGPPTAAKPSRFPGNISVVLGNKEHQSQSLPNVNLEERRAQMLANLSGASHPLQQENLLPAEEQSTGNRPGRSISFKDPTPDKSRMEALSKLGLNRSRALSGETSDIPNGLPLRIPTGVEPEGSFSPPYKFPEVLSPSPSYVHVERKPEILRSDSRRSYEERSPQVSPSPTAVSQSSYYTSSLDNRTPVPPPPEVTSIEINSYGGKSIVVNPLPTPRSDFTTAHPRPDPRTIPPTSSTSAELNSYRVKSEPMTPVPVTINRSDLPDILSSHIDKSQTSSSFPEPPPIKVNSYGGKSMTIQPGTGPTCRLPKAPVPIPVQRPARFTYHAGMAPPKTGRKNSLFRPQSISVEFCGRGPMNDARRAALRKLGLLKEPRTL
ncbi:specifically androgen-regulated gene protein [Gouania willdenowi]|uniref:specifically androgen-regulated gene protein n=1 Tax=Gouania willdenowi TaxID=441366 RepID=UPI0010560C0F|nr:proline and serine-rich protein 2 [Gouania willdenowi]XP_028306821.1 proline and serine-rich protein 2 [Gouania willdenowi]